MADAAAWLIDQVLPERPIRQRRRERQHVLRETHAVRERSRRAWVLSLPSPLRLLLATNPVLIGRLRGIVYRVIAGHLIRQAVFTQQSARTGAVTLIQGRQWKAGGSVASGQDSPPLQKNNQSRR